MCIKNIMQVVLNWDLEGFHEKYCTGVPPGYKTKHNRALLNGMQLITPLPMDLTKLLTTTIQRPKKN